MTDLPAAAIEAATLALHQPKDKCGCQSSEEHAYWLGLDEADAKRALEAAMPHLAAADATTESEGFRAYKAGAAAERERIIELASQLRASIPADHPPSAQASFADYLRNVHPYCTEHDQPLDWCHHPDAS